MHVQQENNNTVADEVDPELLAKVLANPAKLLTPEIVQMIGSIHVRIQTMSLQKPMPGDTRKLVLFQFQLFRLQKQ